MADRVIFVCIIVLAAVYFYATAQIPSLEIGDPLGPKAFPRLLGIGLLITGAMLFMEILRETKAQQAQEKKESEFGHSRVVAFVAIWTGVYFACFELLGYVVATTIYLIPLMAFFNKGRWVMNVATAVLFCLISYGMFNYLLGVNLARGVLPF